MKLTPVLLEWTLTSSFLILAVAALRTLLGRRVSAGLRYALWAAVLARLLVPVQLFPLPAPAALPEPEAGQVLEIAPPAVPAVVPAAASTPAPVPGGTESAGQPALALPKPSGGEAVRPGPGYTPSAPVAEAPSVRQVLGWLWLAGSAAMAAALAVSNVSFARRLRRVRVPLEGADCPLPVYVAPGLPSPCLFGVARPAVYLAADTAENPVMLRHVLAHEYTHFRHGDHVWNVLRSAALALHWWNPLVWLAVVLSRRDCELACDEGALKRLGSGERIAYGRTLLTLVAGKPRPADLFRCTTTMSGGQKSVWERVTRITHAPKRWIWAAAVMVLATALACVCAFGQAAEPEDGPDEPPPAPSQTAEPAPEETRPISAPPAESVQPTLFAGNLDFEFWAVHQGISLRFSNLTRAVTTSANIVFQVDEYVILDLDRDGVTELILKLNGQGGYLILRRTGDKLYGYTQVVRGLQDLKADGTCRGSSSAFDYGYQRVLRFTPYSMEDVYFLRCFPTAAGGESYIVNEEYTDDQAEFEAAVARQEQKENAPWRPWTEYPAEAIRWLEAAGVEWLEPVPSIRPLNFEGTELLLSYKGQNRMFQGPWDYEHQLSDDAVPQVIDLDGDGRDEIVVGLTVSHGAGTYVEELHVFDAVTLAEYPCSGLAQSLIERISCTQDEEYFYFSALDMKPAAIPKSTSQQADRIAFGDLVTYTVEDGRLFCYLGCYMDVEYCGVVKVGLSLSHLSPAAGVCPISFEYEPYIDLPYTQPADTSYRYRNVLQGTAAFWLAVGDTYLGEMSIDEVPDYFSLSDYTVIHEFAVLDLDGDGADEVVLSVIGVGNDMGGYLVLYQRDGLVYGRPSSWRTFGSLKTDGSFGYSDPTGTAEIGFARLNLETGELDRLAYMTSPDHGETFDAVYVDGQITSQTQYSAFRDRQEEKPDAVWYEFTPETVEAVFPF